MRRFILPLLIYRAVNTDAGRAHLVQRMGEEGLLEAALPDGHGPARGRGRRDVGRH